MGKNHPEAYDKEKMAIAIGKSLPVSTKQCIEISSFIRGKKVSEAKKILESVIAMERAIPYKRFNKNVGHRKGNMASGRYPQKASTEVLGLLNSAESNAQFKGLNTNALFIFHISAYTASRPWRFGRQRRRKAKRTNMEIILREAEERKPKENKKAHDGAKKSGEKKDKKEMDKNQQKDG